MIRGAWEAPMAEYFEARGDDVQFDREVHEASNGILFAIDFDELRKVGMSTARLTPGKRLD
jgi:hypothetical protein